MDNSKGGVSPSRGQQLPPGFASRESSFESLAKLNNQRRSSAAPQFATTENTRESISELEDREESSCLSVQAPEAWAPTTKVGLVSVVVVVVVFLFAFFTDVDAVQDGGRR